MNDVCAVKDSFFLEKKDAEKRKKGGKSGMRKRGSGMRECGDARNGKAEPNFQREYSVTDGID
jgi:hypothetical protein